MKDLVDEIIADEFGSPDLELHWLDEDDGDPETVLADRVKLGALTLNEMRAHLGLDPFANFAADRPMALTATGYVPIEAGAGGNPAPSKNREGRTKDRQIAATIQKYSADQPRVPAGNSDGGQWTSGDGNGSPMGASGGAHPQGVPQPTRYAALENGTATDAPSGSASEDHVHLAAQNGSYVGQFYATKNPQIDQTSFTLLAILTQVVDQIGPQDALTPGQYGTKVHTDFAAAVRSEGLPGVTIEETFGLDPEDAYGAEDSIRTDAVLRDDAGNIVAIWDVKTGNARLKPARISELLEMTGATSGVYVFEINPDRGVVLKYQF